MKYFNKEIFSYIDKIHRQKQNKAKQTKTNPQTRTYARLSRVYFNTLTHLKCKNSQKIPFEVKRKYYPGVLRVLAIFFLNQLYPLF